MKKNTCLIFVLLLVSSCGIFDTRDAEPPEQGGGASFLQPDRPELVLTNLQNAIQNMNSVNYIRSISAESFTFTPSSLASDSNPDIWVNWTIENEEIYFNNMSAATQNLSGHSLQIQNQQWTTLPDGDERVTATYVMTINHNRPPSVLPSVAQGSFIIDMTQSEDGLWSISSWTDDASESTFTWSDFKAAFARD